jgi:hypothetical protein
MEDIMPVKLGQKVDRVVRFLMGASESRIAASLVRHGFSQKELDEGWRLLRAVAGERLNMAPLPPKDPEALDGLDAWENKWYPIVEATLAHRYPAVRDRVFLNLSQTEGPELVISVGTLLSRLQAMKESAEQRPARELLAERGLTDAVIAEASQYLARLGAVREAPAVDLEALRAAQEKAEGAMWGWQPPYSLPPAA